MRKIEYKTVPIEELRKNTWNSNRVTVENEEKIKSAIKRNGLFKAIIVRTIPGIDGYEILGGEHRWEQAKELGYTEIPIANMGEIDDRHAKEIGIIDNARYGSDDTISLAEILKEIGEDELQDFLPFGSSDLDAIFSSSDIALDDLDLDGNFEKPLESEEISDPQPEKPVKTHTVMRHKLSLGDAEAMTALIAKTQKEQGFTAEDDLTNAGDALVFLLKDKFGGRVQ